MSGQPEACITGVTLSDPTLCPILNKASRTPLSGPIVEAPVSVPNDMLPTALQTAIQTGSPLIGYNFETDTVPPVRAERTQYTVDTYTNVIQNSAVLVKKPPKETGTLSGVSGPDSTGKYTATVTYRVTEGGPSYTFTGSWIKTVANDETVDVYYNPNDVSRGSIDIEGTGVVPPMMASTPGYELIDFQSASVTGGNLLLAPPVKTVDECANQCDDTPTCTGFNFGGLDTLPVCELVRDAKTTREYVDQKVGFVKETIPTAQTGDGNNPTGTDLTNQGAYCEDAPACNRDIARVINENGSATDPITSFSTSDIESCAYCPVRKYNRAGHVTTNEVGVSKGNASPADAIAQLQYEHDGTFASHPTLESGKCYDVKHYVSGQSVFTALFVLNGDGFNLIMPTEEHIGYYGKSTWGRLVEYFVPETGLKGYYGDPFTDYDAGHPPYISQEGFATSSIKFIPVEYVTNGFQIELDNNLCTITFNKTFNGYDKTIGSNPVSITRTANVFEKYNNEPKYSTGFNSSIFTISEVPLMQLLNILYTVPTRDGYHPPPVMLTNEGYVFLESNNGIVRKRKVPQGGVDFSWYLDVFPSWGSATSIYYTDATNYINPPILSFLTPGPDMAEDPYETLGQYRTLDVAPPPAAQDWAYARRQGCDRNCGSVSQGYAIYQCQAKSGGISCDPGRGSHTEGSDCAGTHISCRPADNSADMKAIFSYQFAGLRIVSSVAISGGNGPNRYDSMSNYDHDTDSLRIRTIYERDTTQTVTTDITKISTLFRPITQQRLAAIGIVQPTLCAPGLYVASTGSYKYCAVCPGNPQPTATQVWRPDPNNPGATLCAFDECPQGKTPDALHGSCRALCTPGTTSIAGGSCSTCPRMQYPWWSVSSATSGPGSYWPDSPIPSNLVWIPNSIIPGTYMCDFMQCEGSGWAVENNTICGGRCLPGTEFNTTTGSCSTRCTIPSNVRIDQTWDSEILTVPDGSGQVTTYKCTMTQCPSGFFTTNYNDRYCQACGDDTTTSFTFNATGFHTQYGYTPPAGVLAGTGVGNWTLDQKRAYCTFTECKPGYRNYVASSRTCTQSCPTTPGFTTTFSSGCTVSSCTVNPGGGILTGGLAASGQCEATVCNPGYGLSGGRCVACTPPQGATVVYDPSPSNQTCRVTSCTLTGTGPPNVTAFEVVNGQCSAICSGGYYLDASGWCSTCSTLGGAVNQTGTVPVYTKNTCQITSCGVDSTLTGKATATVESVQNFGWPPPQYCKTSAAAGYYKLLNGTISQCPAGDPGTQYTYRTSADGNCDLATCSLSTTSDPNEIAYKTGSTIVSDYGQTKCSKVCRSGYKRNASDSNRCSSQCTGATTDPGITVTYGPYECKIASCTSSTGYPASSIDGSTCQVVCPVGSQQVIDPQGRTTCTACSTDLNIAPWSYAYVNTVTQFGGTCTIAYGGCQPWDPDAVTVTQSGSTCVATCKTGYVKDSTGFCRRCPNPNESPKETPTSTSVVTNGVCVSTCKTGHLPNDSSEFYKPVCQKCAPGYNFDYSYGKCIQCGTTTTSTQTGATTPCLMTCRQNHFYNSTTGICTICPTRTAGLDDPGVRLDGYDDITYTGGGAEIPTFNNRCKYIFENIPPGEPSTNTQWCKILPTAKNVGGTVLTRLNTNPTTWACTSTCTAGYTKTLATRICDQCAADYRWNNTACVACGTNMTTPPGPASGTARAACVCQTGYTGTDCMSCATNYTWNGRACVACQNGATIVSGPASGNARSCACPPGTWGSTCTVCSEPTNGTQYVYATCTTTTNTDIRDVGRCGTYAGVPQYRSGYASGSSSSTGQHGSCILCQIPPVSWDNPNFTYISTACGLITDSVLTTPTPCSSSQYRSGFEDGTQAGRPGNPGTCQSCSNPGTNQWVGQLCRPNIDTVIYNTPTCATGQVRVGYSAGNYATQGYQGTCTNPVSTFRYFSSQAPSSASLIRQLIATAAGEVTVNKCATECFNDSTCVGFVVDERYQRSCKLYKVMGSLVYTFDRRYTYKK
jgi:hypothetical protein